MTAAIPDWRHLGLARGQDGKEGVLELSSNFTDPHIFPHSELATIRLGHLMVLQTERRRQKKPSEIDEKEVG